MMRSRTLCPLPLLSTWLSTPIDTEALRVIRPESGSTEPVSSPSRVVLPSPLRPTTPITSPAPSPRLTSSSRIRVP